MRRSNIFYLYAHRCRLALLEVVRNVQISPSIKKTAVIICCYVTFLGPDSHAQIGLLQGLI